MIPIFAWHEGCGFKEHFVLFGEDRGIFELYTETKINEFGIFSLFEKQYYSASIRSLLYRNFMLNARWRFYLALGVRYSFCKPRAKLKNLHNRPSCLYQRHIWVFWRECFINIIKGLNEQPIYSELEPAVKNITITQRATVY